MRKQFIFALSLSLLLACLCSVNPVQAKSKVLSYANFPPAPTFPCVQMERWKKEVEKRTQNKVKITTYPGGTLLGAKNMLRGVVQGQADIGCLCMSYQPGVFPVTNAVGLPFGFKSAETASQVLWEIYKEFKPEEFSQVKVLTMFTSAPSNLMSKKPVRSLSDLKGLEIRASGHVSKALEVLGATPVSMPMPETPEALQKGVVQGLLSSLEVLLDFNFAAYCPYQTITNLQVYPFAVVMNKDKWDSLSQEVKKVMNELGPEQALWTGKYMDRHVQKSLKYAREKYSAEQFKFSQEEQEKVYAQLSGLIKDWKQEARKKGLPADKVVTKIKALHKEYACTQ